MDYMPYKFHWNESLINVCDSWSYHGQLSLKISHDNQFSYRHGPNIFFWDSWGQARLLETLSWNVCLLLSNLFNHHSEQFSCLPFLFSVWMLRRVSSFTQDFQQFQTCFLMNFSTLSVELLCEFLRRRRIFD